MNHACLSLAIGETWLRELAPPARLRDGAVLALRRERLRIDSRTQALVAWIHHGLRTHAAETLEAETLVLTLVRGALGERTSHTPRGDCVVRSAGPQTTGFHRCLKRASVVPLGRFDAPLRHVPPLFCSFMFPQDREQAMNSPPRVTIYHNPACGTSRNTLALIRNAGVEPEIIEYLKAPPDRATLVGLLARAGMRPRELLREKGTLYAELRLGAAHWTDEQLIDHMLANPILINRPLVVTPWGVRLCRPSETVLDILPLSQKGPFTKEDGERVLDERGQRLR